MRTTPEPGGSDGYLGSGNWLRIGNYASKYIKVLRARFFMYAER